jgi:TorA maturation chaperone TorD
MKFGDVQEERSFARDKARELLYRFFSLSVSPPRSSRWERLFDPGFQLGIEASLMYLQNAGEGIAESDMFRLDPNVFPRPGDRSAFSESFDRIFGLIPSRDCFPYEAEYCAHTTDVYRTQRMADVGGFYRAFGLEPSRDEPDRPDHIATELEFMVWLIEKEWFARLEKGPGFEGCADICAKAQRGFFENHLSWWALSFCDGLWKRVGDDGWDEREEKSRSFYRIVGQSLPHFLRYEGAVFGISLPDRILQPDSPIPQPVGGCAGCGVES